MSFQSANKSCRRQGPGRGRRRHPLLPCSLSARRRHSQSFNASRTRFTALFRDCSKSTNAVLAPNLLSQFLASHDFAGPFPPKQSRFGTAAPVAGAPNRVCATPWCRGPVRRFRIGICQASNPTHGVTVHQEEVCRWLALWLSRRKCENPQKQHLRLRRGIALKRARQMPAYQA